MKVALALSDRGFQRALGSLLEHRGHELTGRDEAELCITDTRPADGDVPTLSLIPLVSVPQGGAEDALRRVLRDGGTATWGRPFNPRLLVEVLANHEGQRVSRAVEPDTAPDLRDAPHPWTVIDAEAGVVRAASKHALDLFGIRRAELPVSLGDVLLPEELQHALLAQREGSLTVAWDRPYRYAVWWTGRRGMRNLCLLRSSVATDSRTKNLAVIGQMAATLAHEIRNPVASVAGALDLLDEEEDLEARREIVALARGRLRQMGMLLDDTLRMARPMDADTEPIDVRELVESSLAVLRTDPNFSKIELRFDAPLESIAVEAHAESLGGALSNLLINAAQAQNGAGTIRVEITPTDRLIVVRIRDEGPGIPREKWENIFEPFYTTRQEGTGLGLAYVQRAVEAAHGTVSLEEVDRGACFRIELPRADGP